MARRQSRRSVGSTDVAVMLTVAIAIFQAVSSYLNTYFTVSIGQWIAHATVPRADLQNIAYGQPDATRRAQAHEFIESLPDGYDPMVGQGGLTLSGGQRQRLGIARAMIRDAAILILDEPSSGLDAESERLVFDGLDRLLSGKTTFVISHRMATIRKADVIFVLDHGRIVERGTHDGLLAQNDLYSRLAQLQRPEDANERGISPDTNM